MKTRNQTALISIIIFIVYNIAMFIMPAIRNITFWVAFGFSNLSIIISSLVILGTIDSMQIKEKFNGMPVVYAARAYFIVQLIMGFVEILRPVNFRASILINVVILACGIISLLIVSAGKKEINRVEEKVQEKVFFIKELQTDVEILLEKINDEQTKKELNALVDTIKYSDPMSHSQLATIENQINIKVQELKQNEHDNEEIKQKCSELQQLFAERNKKAKLYKNQPEQNIETQKPLNFRVIISVIISILVLIGVLVTVYYTIIIPNKQYEDAMKLYYNKQYIQASNAFANLGDYKDSLDKQKDSMYLYAIELLDKKDFDNAIREFEKLEDYKDSIEKMNDAIYQKASELYSNKEYSKAADEFLKLDNYKDSKDKLIEIYNLFGEEDVIYFGKYNGKPIAWQILDTREHKVLLIAKDPIDEMAYNSEYKSVNWEDSSIRKWLNGEFYNSFDQTEKGKILKNTAEIDDIFLLSNDNIKSYPKLRNASSTWWIESTGEDATKAMYVTEDGSVNTSGDVITKLHGVRPSIWLNLD